MSLLLCFLCLQFEIEANASVDMYYSYPTSNLFFIHPGFANPSISRGLLGFSLNPAALVSAENSEAMLCFTSSMKTNVLTQFEIPIDTILPIPIPIIDTLDVPTNLGVQQLAGLDFLGALFKVKGWRLGIGYQNGDYIGLDFSASVQPDADYEIDFDYTLTHDDIPDIPTGDSIPVHIAFEGEGDVLLFGKGDGNFQSNSFVFAAANRVLGLDFGLGWQITPISLTGNFDALFNGQVMGGGALSIESVDDWTIDATFDVEIDLDSTIYCLGNANTDFYLNSFYMGLKREWGWLSIGLCGDFSFPVSISGDWDFSASLPNGYPLIRFDDDNLDVDTVNKVITGHAKLVLYDFEEDTLINYQGVINSMFLGTGGVTGGIDFRIWRFELGSFGGFNSSSDMSYMKVRAGLNLGFRTFIPLRAGIIFHFQYYDFGGIPMSALPVVSFGGGTDFNIKKFNIFLNLAGNTTQGAASFIIPGIVGGESTRSALLALGAGVRYHF